jgi:hypothetical protein
MYRYLAAQSTRDKAVSFVEVCTKSTAPTERFHFVHVSFSPSATGGRPPAAHHAQTDQRRH